MRFQWIVVATVGEVAADLHKLFVADLMKTQLIKKAQQPRVLEVRRGAVAVPHLQRAADELVAAGAFHAINA